MKINNKINQVLIIITLINNHQLLSVNTLNEDEIESILNSIDISNLFTPYNNYISQASLALSNKDLTDLISNLSNAAEIDSAAVLDLIQNGQQFSYETLSPIFNEAELQQFATSILKSADVEIDNISSYANLYASKGLNDNNFENAVNMLNEGITNADLSKVSSALNIIESNAANDSFISQLGSEISNLKSPLNERLNISFNQQQLESTFGSFSPSKPIFNPTVRMSALANKLSTALTSNDVPTASAILSEMKSIRPVQTAELFQNGDALEYANLNSLSTQQLSTLAKAAGLPTTDIVSYVTGNYVGPVNNGGMNMGGAGGANLGGNAAEQEAYDNLSTVVEQIKNSVNGLAKAQSALAETQATISKLQSQLSEEGADQDAISAEIAQEQADAAVFKDAIDVVTGEDAV